MTPAQFRRRLEDLKAECRVLGQQLSEKQQHLALCETDGQDLQKAAALIQEAALQVQRTLQIRLTAIVTSALRAVFQEKDISFQVTFDSKRGRTECFLEVLEGGIAVDPMDARGGGVVDIISFALRISFWSITHTHPVLILDEPLKFLSPDLGPLAASIIQKLCADLGLQIVMVTHRPEFEEVANQLFRVVYNGGMSEISV